VPARKGIRRGEYNNGEKGNGVVRGEEGGLLVGIAGLYYKKVVAEQVPQIEEDLALLQAGELSPPSVP
jgi:hypothetical protein